MTQPETGPIKAGFFIPKDESDQNWSFQAISCLENSNMTRKPSTIISIYKSILIIIYTIITLL
ncbi:hypothetical protein GCM10011361_23720 [Muriicola marianensis]|uniref:Uncharacterized protein n=1 Tax=Muriicola marianensis TaxID=1324801 RepID=A0ABQ1R506_9FLAO|nr:hypothetical protein GCM10011361_23720 [Muriicola marianensis]